MANDAECSGGAPWSISAIPYHALDRSSVHNNALLFNIVAAASFIETTSDVYKRNLAAFFHDDPDVSEWLERAWEPEELQHGRALRRYVEAAWPDFNWDAAYNNYLADFLRFCSVDQLAATRTLELAARCVVETGTATFYRTLAETSPEPVLREIATAISADEVRHYKHFYRFFLRYRKRERPSRLAVARTLWARIRIVDTEDAFYANKHAYLARNSAMEFRAADYAAIRAQLRPYAARHFPHRMAIKMLLKPLRLNKPINRLAVRVMASASRLLFLR